MDTKDLFLERARAIAQDDRSGATDLTLRAADLVLDAMAAGQGRAVAEALLRAKPMMASLLNLACLALDADLDAVRSFRDRLESAVVEAARRVAAFMRERSSPWTVLTLSASRVVEAAIRLSTREGLVSRVIVAESRPRLEGAGMAQRLAQDGCEVAITHDAALPGLCGPEDLVLVGADAVLPDAFVNKAGTFALFLAAREVAAERVVVTTSHKVLLPEAVRFFRVAEEVQVPGSPAFLDVQFERTPIALASALVTENG